MIKNPTTINAKGLALVKSFESFYARPYWDRPLPDPRAVLTMGYGTTKIDGRPVRSTDRMTERQAAKMLTAHINGPQYAHRLTAKLDDIGVTLNDNEYSALLSAIYNLGDGILDKGRSLGDALRADNWRDRVPPALMEYVEPGSNVEEGLRRRRRAEIALFEEPTVVVRPLRFGAEEQKHIDLLRAERRTAQRHGGWDRVDSAHQRNAERAKSWLRHHANQLEKSSKIKDRDYLSRKVTYLRDVALNRNGRGT